MSSLNPIGIPFIELPVIESTNNYAMGLVREGMAHHGTAVFAHEQTRGKGQRNKEWTSAGGQNIILSLVIEPGGLGPGELFLLSKAIAVAASRFIGRYIADEISIKWPNDIYWRDRKAAGILIENLWQQNEWKFAVAGIGINVNQTDFGDLGTKAVSLKQVTGQSFDVLKLARELCEEVEKQYLTLINDPEAITTEYKRNLYGRDMTARFRKGNLVFEAMVKDVTANGELIVQHVIEERFAVGEVEWLVKDE